MPKTKIVCTIGPSSWEANELTNMINSGMTVARINGAFADNAELERVQNIVRGVSNQVALMLDIKGTEVRMNKFGEPITVGEGDIIEVGPNDTHKIFPRTYPDLYKDVRVGTQMLFDDGNLEAHVVEITDTGVIRIKFDRGGLFKEGKSINVPGTLLNNPPLTQTDISQIKFCAENKWEFVAASFIRTREDAQLVRDELANSGMKLIAKIEDPIGVENLEQILEVVDGVMVARGDMAVEMPYEQVPLVQKKMVSLSNAKGKVVIVATQMMESMIKNERPTRAEISDVANACLDGASATMLSGETSAGEHPALVVASMSKILSFTENNTGTKPLDQFGDSQNTEALKQLLATTDQQVYISNWSLANSLGSLNTTKEIIAVVGSQQEGLQFMGLVRGVSRFVYSSEVADQKVWD